MSQQINLFNPIFLAQKKVFSARTMALGLGVVAAALVLTHVAQRVQLAGLKQQTATAEAQLQDAQQQLARFAAEKKRSPSKVLDDQIARLESQHKAQEALLESFASGTLGNTDGFARYLDALARQTLAGVWLTGFSANGSDGPSVIRGRLLAPELLPAYLRILNREESLRGRGFAELRMQAPERAATGQAGTPDDTTPRHIEFTLGATRPAAGSTR
jgi:hypothetical protein